ncbi:hypothetical protein [Actinophytocola sp.]|uniref:hypothetical protein n=1 Tax=Actinophytocola sp. TaxID=1872138 RepID=UPI003D6B8396
MAWVEQVGQHSWRVRYRTDSGYGSVSGFDSHKVAQDYLQDMRVDRRRGTWLDPAGAKIRLGKWVERWIETIDVENPNRGELPPVPAAAHPATLGQPRPG